VFPFATDNLLQGRQPFTSGAKILTQEGLVYDAKAVEMMLAGKQENG
jgi:hypothetical protein